MLGLDWITIFVPGTNLWIKSQYVVNARWVKGKLTTLVLATESHGEIYMRFGKQYKYLSCI